MTFRSITFKFLLFLLIFSAAGGAGVIFLEQSGAPHAQSFLLLGILVYFLLTTASFLFLVSQPLHRITRQIKCLLTGKKYRRLRPNSTDEIGIITHFFNKITLSLESISGDIVEKKRLTSELDVARKIQKDVLPKKAPEILGLDIVARSRPAAEMGGDSFDFLQNEHHTMFYIGDVTGHGVPAGLVMMMVNTLIHAFSKRDMFPHEILDRVNSILHHRISAEQFMSMVMLRWDEKKQEMFYIGAGHEYLLIYRATERKVEKIPTGGIALRMTPDIGQFIEERDIVLGDNDVLLLYTDGITEAKNPEGEMYTVERLQVSLQKHGFRDSAEKVFDKISKDFSDFMGEYIEQEDDITMIVIKKLPAGDAARSPIKLTIGKWDEERDGDKNKRWEWEDDE